MVYTKDQLETLPRSKLQAICKGFGFKANDSTAKIISNILTFEEDDAAHKQRISKKQALPQKDQDNTIRRVTRGSTTTETDAGTNRRVTRSEMQDAKPSRRASTRLKLNPQVTAAQSTSSRKSKVTQTSLGKGRPVAVGGSGPRAVTRASTASGKSRKHSGKKKVSQSPSGVITEEEEEEEEEDEQEDDADVGNVEYKLINPPVPSKQAQRPRRRELSATSEAVVVTGLPPTPAATPSLPASLSEEPPRAMESRQDFILLQKIQDDVAQLSSTYSAMKEQVMQINALQQEVRRLRAATEKIPGLQNDLARARVELQALGNTPQELIALRQEVNLLRETILRAVTSSTSQPPTQAITPPYAASSPYNVKSSEIGHTEQVLGKRVRDSPATSLYNETFANLAGIVTTTDGQIGVDSPILKSPRKKLRLESASEEHVEYTQDSSSPIVADPRNQDLQTPISNDGGMAGVPRAASFDFTSIFNFENDPHSTQHNPNVTATSPMTMLGAPPPGVAPDFFQQQATTPLPLPFSLVPNTSSQPIMSTPHHRPLREDARQRMNPYKRPAANTGFARTRTPSHTTDPFGLLGSSDLLSTKMQTSANRGEPTVGINPAQLIGGDTFEVDKTPMAARTMYGTELDGDTRFGEFGIDGLTKGFWRAPGYQY